MRMLRGFITVVFAVFAFVASAAPAVAEPIELPQAYPCLQPTPSAVAPPSSGPIPLRLAVVLHDVEMAEGRALLARAEKAYAPLGIDLQPTFLLAHMPDHDPAVLFPRLKALFGGKRPAWAHAVMLISSVNLRGPDTPVVGGDGLAGQADCIGGIEDPTGAFAVGEVGENQNEGAEIFAHELGHLLGAHHHYANCGQGTREGSGTSDACTLMFNDIGLTSLVFSTGNAAVVRGHVEAFAKPLTAVPPPDGTELTPIPPKVVVDLCATPAFTDPAGDDMGFPGLEAGEGDVRSGQFFLRDGKPWFRISVSEADGSLDRAARVAWYLTFDAAGTAYSLETEWDGKGAPVTTLVDLSSSKVTAVPGTVVVRGTPGLVEIAWPLAADAVLRFERLRGSVGPLVKEAPYGYNNDSADPAVKQARLSDCATTAPAGAAPSNGAAPSGGVAAAPGSAAAPAGAAGAPVTRSLTAPALRVRALTTSARRATRDRRLAVRLTGTAGNVLLRLVDRRGREVGRGTVRRVAGTATAYVQLGRAIRAGRYVLVVSAAGSKAVRTTIRLR